MRDDRWWPFGRRNTGSDPDQGQMFQALADAAATEDGAKLLAVRATLAERSLKTVTLLTEYEDGKVARILTVVAFLSAVIGALFTRFQSEYRWSNGCWTVKAGYVTFFAYVILVSISVYALIAAIRPRFNRLQPSETKDKTPLSFIFSREIAAVKPQAWAAYWLKDFDAIAKAAANDIAETYLIARKIEEKLADVAQGMSFLRWGLVALVTFLICAFASFMFATAGP